MELTTVQIYMAKHLPELAADGKSIHIRLNSSYWKLLSASLIDAGVDTRIMRRGNAFRVTLQDDDFVEVHGA